MITKRFDGWYFENRGPFATKQEALGSSLTTLSYSREKHEKDLTYCIDYNHTYTTDPKLWNSIIQLLYLRKNNVVCITRDHNGGEDEILDDIGAVIGKKNVYFTHGMSKKDYAKQHDIKVDIWIDDNPKHIFEDG
jgi:hypothetical protein